MWSSKIANVHLRGRVAYPLGLLQRVGSSSETWGNLGTELGDRRDVSQAHATGPFPSAATKATWHSVRPRLSPPIFHLSKASVIVATRYGGNHAAFYLLSNPHLPRFVRNLGRPKQRA